MPKRHVCISLEGNIAADLEMIASPLIDAADPEGLRSHNTSCCGSMRAHFAVCRLGAWKLNPCKLKFSPGRAELVRYCCH